MDDISEARESGLYTQDDVSILTDDFSVTGTAYWHVEIEHCADRDIGGRDGLECTSVALCKVVADGVTLDFSNMRNISNAFRAQIARMESAIGEWIDDRLREAE
jgi:hypothetical protein